MKHIHIHISHFLFVYFLYAVFPLICMNQLIILLYLIVTQGMIRLSEEERLQTLESLKTNRAELLSALSKLPFVIDTPTLKRRQTDIETKIREIENAIGIFNRTTVYVAK